jgi:hypothetical protein
MLFFHSPLALSHWRNPSACQRCIQSAHSPPPVSLKIRYGVKTPQNSVSCRSLARLRQSLHQKSLAAVDSKRRSSYQPAGSRNATRALEQAIRQAGWSRRGNSFRCIWLRMHAGLPTVSAPAISARGHSKSWREDRGTIPDL